MIWYSLGIFLLVMGFWVVFGYLDKFKKRWVLFLGLTLVGLAIFMFEFV